MYAPGFRLGEIDEEGVGISPDYDFSPDINEALRKFI